MVYRTECQAKLNLFLTVGPPDASGYHPLRSVFQSISLADRLTVETGVAAIEFLCSDPTVPKENTLSKALRLFQEYTEVPDVRITLDKRIPAQSGLGGGSSDAGRLIAILHEITGRRLSTREQREIAGAVGSDVPYFLVGGRAQIEGYGERVTPLDDPEPLPWYAVVRPPFGCSTPEMYRALDRYERPFLEFGHEPAVNDFESVAPWGCLHLKAALLAQGAVEALLSGSGSAVFGRFGNEPAARSAAEALAGEGMVWVTRATTRADFARIERGASGRG
jgi:4-diphosphocytidyl-2-C-methyl-D-erythritol kinase